MHVDKKKELNNQLNNQKLQEKKRANLKTRLLLKKVKGLFKALNGQVERIVANSFLVDIVEKD